MQKAKAQTKDYVVGTYVNKKVRPKRLGKMCPVCSRCSDRSFCRHRKNVKLMRKCENCKTCKDKANCDVFYFSFQNKITIPIEASDEEGNSVTIRKSFSGKTGNEAIYNSEKYKKDVNSGTVKPVVKSKVNSIESIVQEFEDYKNSIGKTNDNSYLTNMQTLKRLKTNKWLFEPIRKVKRKQIEDFLLEERNAGQSNSVLKKDYNMLKQAFEIAKYKDLVHNNYFEGPYAIVRPISLKKDKKTEAFTPEENLKILKYIYTHNVTHKHEFLICFHHGIRIGETLAISKDSIDLENNILHIDKTTTLDKSGKVIIGPCTKTPEGERKLVITELTHDIFKAAIDNMIPNENNLLFCKSDGTPYTDSALNSYLKRIAEKAGIKSRVHNHKLRNNFNTRGVEIGIDYDALKLNAGHADIHQTIDTYATPKEEFLSKELQKYVDYVKMCLGDLIYSI